MSQLVCPLCGRFVSLRFFDPSSFEPDIFAVNVRGLGRGKGVAVSEMFSVLDEPTITGPIADRCGIILSLISGRRGLSSGGLSVLRAEVESLRGEVVKERMDKEDAFAMLADQEEQALFWRKEASRLLMEREEHDVKLVMLEDETNKWRNTAIDLKTEVKRLESEMNEQGDNDDDDDEELMLVIEEMQEILDRINTSANTDFDNLSDAVAFLLEGG